MNSVNISLNAIELKRYLRCKNEYLQNWKPNANIKIGGLVPVLFNEKPMICLMSWGFDKYETGRYTPFARMETLKEKWGSNIETCVVPIKGFHFKWQQNKTLENYYVTEENNDILFLAGVYYKTQKFSKIQLSVILLTQATMNNETLYPYNDRMPVILRKESIQKWLKSKMKEEQLIKCVKNEVTFQEPQLIGPWIDDPKNIQEDIILRSKEEWKIECEAETIDWDTAFDLY